MYLDLHENNEKHTERVEPLLRIGVASRTSHDGFANITVHFHTVHCNIIECTVFNMTEHSKNEMQSKEVVQYITVEYSDVQLGSSAQNRTVHNKALKLKRIQCIQSKHLKGCSGLSVLLPP